MWWWLTGQPEVTVDPPSQTVQVAQPVKFTTTVSGVGEENFTYQWIHDGDIIDGEANNTLAFDSVTRGHDGTYQCVVRNEYGDSATSNVSLLSQLNSVLFKPYMHLCYRHKDCNYCSTTKPNSHFSKWYWMFTINMSSSWSNIIFLGEAG